MDPTLMSSTPWWLGPMAFPLAVLVLLAGLTRGEAMRAFRGSNFALVAVLAIGGGGMGYAVAASPQALRLASAGWPLGLALALVSLVCLARPAGRVGLARGSRGFD